MIKDHYGNCAVTINTRGMRECARRGAIRPKKFIISLATHNPVSFSSWKKREAWLLRLSNLLNWSISKLQ